MVYLLALLNGLWVVNKKKKKNSIKLFENLCSLSIIDTLSGDVTLSKLLLSSFGIKGLLFKKRICSQREQVLDFYL